MATTILSAIAIIFAGVVSWKLVDEDHAFLAIILMLVVLSLIFQ